jgi:hypothetical protein
MRRSTWPFCHNETSSFSTGAHRVSPSDMGLLTAHRPAVLCGQALDGSMLAEIYNWFTEGFDTRDLKDAKALLDELNC